MNRLIALITNHSHYWGVPHKDEADQFVMCCYGCGKVKLVMLDELTGPLSEATV